MMGIIRRIWTIISPAWLRTTLKPFLYSLRWVNFIIKFKFSPPSLGTDLVGYESFFTILDAHNLLNVEGDIVEIGAFLGGGTYKLAKYLEQKRSSKKIHVIDIFNIRADQTLSISGVKMADIYEHILKRLGKGLSQYEIFQQVTKTCKNLVVLRGDSKEVDLQDISICFAFIDGNHDPSYIRNDFSLVWTKLSQMGVIAFHDYGYDLPHVTNTIDDLLSKHIGEIKETWINEEKHILYIKRAKE